MENPRSHTGSWQRSAPPTRLCRRCREAGGPPYSGTGSMVGSCHLPESRGTKQGTFLQNTKESMQRAFQGPCISGAEIFHEANADTGRSNEYG